MTTELIKIIEKDLDTFILCVFIFIHKKKIYMEKNGSFCINGKNENIDKSAFIKNIMKKYDPEYLIKIYNNRNTTYNKLSTYILINDCLPDELSNKKLYNHVRVVVRKFKNDQLTKKEIKKYSQLKHWNWEYIHLSNKGILYNNILNKVSNGIKLSKKENITYNYLINNQDNIHKYFKIKLSLM